MRLGMKPLFIAVALSLLATPAAAQRAPIVLVLEGSPAGLDAAALRRDVAEASGREVIALADARARLATESLAVAGSPDGRRWVLRHARDGHSAWRSTEVARPDALRATLVRVIGALLASDWAHANGEVLDPWRWDPLRAALRLELMEPFARRTRYAWSELVDPFVPAQVWIDLVDPWSSP